VDVGGKTVRIITTHLEAVPAPLDGIRKAQARELLAGPAAKPVPTVLLGDFNAEPDTAGDAAALILAAGYADSWAAMQPGLTCCQAADLRNSTSELATRIDLVFNKGDLVVASAARTGATPLPPGTEVRWASDHAGVVVRFHLFPPQAWLPLVTRGD
jgi:endonuclease/exonuclease/phosphatase family metal-dependent hydrolase